MKPSQQLSFKSPHISLSNVVLLLASFVISENTIAGTYLSYDRSIGKFQFSISITVGSHADHHEEEIVAAEMMTEAGGVFARDQAYLTRVTQHYETGNHRFRRFRSKLTNEAKHRYSFWLHGYIVSFPLKVEAEDFQTTRDIAVSIQRHFVLAHLDENSNTDKRRLFDLCMQHHRSMLERWCFPTENTFQNNFEALVEKDNLYALIINATVYPQVLHNMVNNRNDTALSLLATMLTDTMAGREFTKSIL